MRTEYYGDIENFTGIVLMKRYEQCIGDGICECGVRGRYIVHHDTEAFDDSYGMMVPTPYCRQRLEEAKKAFEGYIDFVYSGMDLQSASKLYTEWRKARRKWEYKPVYNDLQVEVAGLPQGLLTGSHTRQTEIEQYPQPY